MAYDRTSIQKFTARDAPEWVQVGDRPAYVGYIADEAEGSDLGLAYIRFRKGVTFEFLWAYDEVAVVTKGRLTLRTGDRTITAGPGEVVHMPAGVSGVFEIDEDMEAVCVHYPTDAKAGREWDGAERLPAESEIRLVSSDTVWRTGSN
jgi:ethanolamine utilization protein EutQ (cupin superfamily)